MNTVMLHGVTGVIIFCLGLRALLLQSHLVRKTLALNFMSTGIFMIVMAMADRTQGAVPDPVPHAVILTSIVVSVCATALLLACAGQLHAIAGSADVREPKPGAGEDDA